MNMPPTDSNFDVFGEARQLLDAWCDRRAYQAIYMMWDGLRLINGLTDGWHEFLRALKDLRIMAKSEDSGITEAEVQKLLKLSEVVSGMLYSR